MPIIRAKDAQLDEPETAHPVLGTFSAKLFSDSGGLTQFGAFTETLPPGSKSSLRHWHQTEDEMIYMLSGTVTVYEGDSTGTLNPGDAATFKAGEQQGHYLENTGNVDATYLVIGTRSDKDVVTYPDHDRILRLDRKKGERSHTTIDGKPADTPY